MGDRKGHRWEVTSSDLPHRMDFRCTRCGAEKCETPNGDCQLSGQDICPEALPYPWCRDPAVCISVGHCPKDPNCGE